MIGDKIYKFRKSRNLSQEEFANSIGVTRQIVSKWENNQSMPGVDKLKKISDVYNIPYEELLNGTEYNVKKKNNLKTYLLLICLIFLFQVIFIVIVSIISSNNMKSKYRCIGTQTYNILDIYDSEDNNYSYVTLKNYNNIKTVKVSRLISSIINEGNKYQFIFRSNNSNNDIDYIFNNNEIINVLETEEDINIFTCK